MNPYLRGQLKQDGAEKRGELGVSPSTVDLPIFKDWDGHSVKNWISHPPSFAGLDPLGFGLHPSGIVDCINIPLCGQFRLADAHDFGLFWRYESNSTEQDIWENDRQHAHERMLRRLIVRVQLNLTDPRFVPDPDIHHIRVATSLSQRTIRDGAVGSVILRSGFNKKLHELRANAMCVRPNPRDSYKKKYGSGAGI
jgi:hypothetical protein